MRPSPARRFQRRSTLIVSSECPSRSELQRLGSPHPLVRRPLQGAPPASGCGDQGHPTMAATAPIAMKPCLDCGEPANGSRCEVHRRKFNQQRRPTTTDRGYGSTWQAYAKGRIRQEPWCAVCGATDDLTLDHANDVVMCRRCNSGRRWDGRGSKKSWNPLDT